MHELTIGPWLLRCDLEATKAAYLMVPSGGAEQCGCLYCRNYALARDAAFSGPIRSFFEQFGIDYTKDAEVCEYCHDSAGGRLYDGWFHFIGEMVTGPEGEIRAYKLHSVPNFEVSFRCAADQAHPPFQGKPLVQVEFVMPLPWVIDAPEPP